MSDKPRDDLHYFQWEVSDANSLQKMLNMEKITLAQIGELFLAVMKYVDQVEVDVSPELSLLYISYQARVDSKREARVKVGLSKAENGRKGGEAKAENARKQKATTGYKPPTKTRFKAMINRITETEDEMQDNIPNAQKDAFFNYLRDNHWTIKGVPIRSEKDLEVVLRSKFANSEREPQCSLFFTAFEYVFAKFPDLRDEDGNSLAEDVLLDFFDTYDESSDTFEIDGKKCPASRWGDALREFMKQWSENIPP